MKLISTRRGPQRPFDPTDPRGLDLVPSRPGSLGCVQTYAPAGLVLWLGPHRQSAFGPFAHPPLGRGRPSSGRGGWGASVEGRAIGRDLFLDGNTWRESRRVARLPRVGKAVFGAVPIMPWARLSCTHTVRSREFRGQSAPFQHGSVSLSGRF